MAEGRDLRLAQGHRFLRFEEEHRLTAAADVALRLGTREGRQSAEREVSMSRCQSSRCVPATGSSPPPGPPGFEAGRRVPGAPETGVSWAAGATGDRAGGWLHRLGLAVTMLGGGIALLGPPLVGRPRVVLSPRWRGAGRVLWVAQGWAVVRGLFGAPEVFLAAFRRSACSDVPALVLASRDSGKSGAGDAGHRGGGGLSRVHGGAARAAAAADTSGGGRDRRDLGLGAWGSAWPRWRAYGSVDPWRLALARSAAAAAVLVPAALLPAAASRPAAATAAGIASLTVFALLLLAARLGGGGAWLAPVCEQPALVALPTGVLALWLGAPRGGA